MVFICRHPEPLSTLSGQSQIYAIKLAQVEVAKRLLDHGASVDQFDGFGFSPYLEFILFQELIEQDASQAQVQWRLSPPEAKARLAAFQQLFAQR